MKISRQRFKSGTQRPLAAPLKICAGLGGAGLYLIASMASLNSVVAQPAIVCSQDPSLAEPSLPSDVCGSISALHPENFHTLSWQLFKFLVWPAEAQRGLPDTTKKISDAGPRTFETFKADWEIFRPDTAEPAGWDVSPSVAEPCGNRPNMQPGELVLASFQKFGNLKQGEQGSRHLLVAQNQTYVRYQVGYNRKVFDTIVSKGLYNPGTVGAIHAPAPDRPVPDGAIEPETSMTVKSAWIELPGQPPSPDASRFYVREAWVQEPKWTQEPGLPACRKANVALVGLHIVYKTAKLPQWIWSTFEHVDNVPDEGAPAGRYTFHNGDINLHMTAEPQADYLIPLPTTSNGPGDPPRAFQVERTQQLSSKVIEANARWQTELKTLGSVWQNYKLVMTQWPMFPMTVGAASVSGRVPHCGIRNGEATVNVTMETFLQTQEGCSPSRTCMGCHEIARKTDSVFSIMTNPNQPREMTSPNPREYAIKALQELLEAKQAR
jgi:hypothetical protein